MKWLCKYLLNQCYIRSQSSNSYDCSQSWYCYLHGNNLALTVPGFVTTMRLPMRSSGLSNERSSCLFLSHTTSDGRVYMHLTVFCAWLLVCDSYTLLAYSEGTQHASKQLLRLRMEIRMGNLVCCLLHLSCASINCLLCVQIHHQHPQVTKL